MTPTLPELMTAIEITEPGGPEKLAPTRRLVPQPAPGEVLIKVVTAGVNRPDCLQRQGGYPPPPGESDIPGLEVAGTIVALGDSNTELTFHTKGHLNWCYLLQEALLLSVSAEPLEKRLRVEGVKTGRITALDLPGQIEQALGIGLLSAAEAQLLREYDRKVMDIVNVDDFTTEELMAGVQAESQSERLRQIA